MKKLPCFALAILMATHAHAADEWLAVAESDTAKFSIKIATLEITSNKGGQDVVSVLGRTENSDKTINLYKMYVRTTDCEAGYGKLVTTDTDGTYQFDNEFALDGGNVASGKAEALCYFYKAVKEEVQKMSL